MLNAIVKSLPLSLLVFAQVIGMMPAQARTTPPQLIAQAFRAPFGAAVPDRRRLPPPRASGDCSTGDIKLASLLPGEAFGMPLTGSANPEFYVYLPEVSADYVEFSIFKGRKSIHKAQFAAPTEAGVVAIALPEDIALEAGTNTTGKPIAYQWYFNVVCDAEDRSTDLKTNGWIHRLTDIDISEQSATELADMGLWYDALNAAYNEGQTAVDNLLESVELNDFVGVPLLPELMPMEPDTAILPE
ncbi:protein of unknown function DUF928 [[Leptolyngbya] sp. PCC 7376]|uniref:DUF928 domain-containing protein n=1 Tax=[Leptolyngbya] sp. PCC 7376 TaxID=111781 RepID=UPI00029EC6A5|nr:DUF928 domain-containing protein [[Leptolyngbya] sp. PCC 7376]AFY38361.1 protein of unknown function DUF928 [[Leptolyngbya] sp. PCC 7376]